MKAERHKKVESLLKQKIDLIIRNELNDPRLGLMSIVHINVSKELDFATVHISHPGDDETRKAVTDTLQKASGYIEKNLARSVRLRKIPKLSFKLDDSLIHAARIDEILNTINDENDAVAQDIDADESTET